MVFIIYHGNFKPELCHLFQILYLHGLSVSGLMAFWFLDQSIPDLLKPRVMMHVILQVML